MNTIVEFFEKNKPNLLILMGLFLCLQVYSQKGQPVNGLKIDAPKALDNGNLSINVKVDKVEKNAQIGAQNFIVTEKVEGKLDTLKITKVNTGVDKLRFLFYTDENTDPNSNEPIITAINKSLKANNIDKIYSNADRAEDRTFDSFETLSALIEKDVKDASNHHIIVVFSDDRGIFSFNSPSQEGKASLLNQISKNATNVSFHPFLVGKERGKFNTDFSEQATRKTKNLKDRYYFYKGVNTIRFENDLLDIQKNYFDNYTLIVEPGNKQFRGEKRNLTVYWNTNKNVLSDSFSYTLGTPLKQAVEDKYSITKWLTWWFIGAILVMGLLAFLSFLVPEIRRGNFKKKYVKVYGDIKQEGVQKRDPVTGDVFQDDDLVVVKCQHMTAYSSWQFHKNQCAYYPDECEEGVANVDSSRFFSQEGINRRLNWLWFGILGGFISWSLLSLFNLIPATTTGAFSGFWLDLFSMDTGLKRFLTAEWTLGLAIGLCLTFFLSLVEERGQSSRLHWGRIILRTLLGGILSMFIFIFGFYLATKIPVQSLFLQYLPTWLLLGLVLGLVLSIKSTVIFSRGILGGLLGAFFAFAFYYFFSKFFQSAELAKMFSFILFGGLMGVLLAAVINRAGDFYLEYIEPEKFRRTNPIGKWLKAGIDVQIGSEPSSYVFVKWNDQAVQGRHANLSFDGKRVYLEAFAETLLNGRILDTGTRHPIKNNDVIKLGGKSVTKFLFRESGDGTQEAVSPDQLLQEEQRTGGGIVITKK